MWEHWTVQNKTKFMDASDTQKQILSLRALWWKIPFCKWFILCLLAIWEGCLRSFTTLPMLPTYLNKVVVVRWYPLIHKISWLAPISRCWNVSGGFFCCHLSLHSCTLGSVKNLQKKCERKFAGKSIRRWQEKRRRHSRLKTLSNAPAGTSTSLGDQATSMFTAGTVTATIPSLSVSALAPWVL